MTSPIAPFLAKTRVAYFTMEMAIRYEIHTYSGGLGVLAGDIARTAADLGMPMVFVLLVSRAGYFRQIINGDRWQVEQPNWWAPSDWCVPLDTTATVEIEGRPVAIRPWLYVQTGVTGHQGADPAARHRPGAERRVRPRADASPLWRRCRLSPEAGNHPRHRRRPGAARAWLQHRHLAHERGPRGAADARPARQRADGGRRNRGPRRRAQSMRVHHPYAGRRRTGPFPLRSLRQDRARPGSARHRQGVRRPRRTQHDAAGAQPFRLRQRRGGAARGNDAADVPRPRDSCRHQRHPHADLGARRDGGAFRHARAAMAPGSEGARRHRERAGRGHLESASQGQGATRRTGVRSAPASRSTWTSRSSAMPGG